MKLSAADFTFPLLAHDKVLELITWLEIDAVDLGLLGNRSHIRPEHLSDDFAGIATRTRTTLERLGLEVADVLLIPWTDFETLAVNHPSAAARESSRELFDVVLEFAARLESPGITLLPGLGWPGEGRESSVARAASELRWRSERAAARGIELSVEAHVGSLIGTPALAAELLARTPGLRLTFDPSHFVFQGFAEPDWRALIEHARHIHLRGAAPSRMQTPVSASTIDLPSLIDAARTAEYHGFLALEYVWTEWERCNETDNLSETVALRDQLRALI